MGGSKKNEGNPGRGVYKIHIWTITNSSGPHQVINTDWSLIINKKTQQGLGIRKSFPNYG